MIRFPLMRTASLAAVALVLVSAAQADTVPAVADASDALADAAAAPSAAGSSAQNVIPEIVVTAQHLDEVRSHIQTQTGASTYTIDAKAIEATPGGDNTLLNQEIGRAHV